MSGGQQIDVGIGDLTYSLGDVSDTAVGSEVTTAAGSSAAASLVRLRSRKTGGGAASFLLTGVYSTGQHTAPAAQVAALLSSPTISGAQGAFGKSRSRALTGTLVQGFQTAIGPPVTQWDVGDITLQSGLGGTFNVFSTGPSSYTSGGIYGVASNGTQLPSGLSLSESGVLTESGASANTYNNVYFDYGEPGAYTTLTLHNASVTGTLPYMGTWYPNEGVVPFGYNVVSPDDSTLRGSILSTWDDGSAKVIVIAGSTNFSTTNTTKTIRLRVGQPSGTSLTTNDIVSAVQTVSVNFGTPLSLTLTTSNHDHIWWQNPQVICARYRLPITNKGDMEAVIDVHAFAGGRAFVEVVIENGKLNPASPVKPTAQSYSGATVSVNGTNITPVGGVSSVWTTSTYTSNGWGDYTLHEAFRSWYCSGWVGGDPGITVTHDTLSMQSHPLFVKFDKETTLDFATYIPLDGLGYPQEYWRYGDTIGLSQTYAADTYLPWAFGRIQFPNMGSGGEDQAYGPLPKWEQRYLQSGSKHVHRATIQSALACLTYNINYRSTATNLVPTLAEVAGKSTSAGYPRTAGQFGSFTGYGTFEVAHEPAIGLLAFMCRPSPCFIEIAQKIAHYNGVGNASASYRNLWGYYYQTRGKAFCMRNLGHAIFLTPSSVSANMTAWRTAGATNMEANLDYMLKWDDDPNDKLNIMWDHATSLNAGDETPTYSDGSAGGAVAPDGIPNQFSVWLSNWLGMESYKLIGAKLLNSTAQAKLERLSDWAQMQPIRWVNEQPNGGWRYLPYRTTSGTVDGTNNTGTGQLDDWGTMRAYRNPNSPSAVAGEWRTNGGNDLVDYHHGTNYLNDWIVFNGPNQNLMYVPIFWGALVTAVERDLPGADSAWNTVLANVTNLTTFRDWFSSNGVMYGWWPRNK